MHDETAGPLIDPLHGRPRAYVDAEFAEFVHEPTHQIWIECREHPLGTLEHRDMRAGPRREVRKFGGDVAAANQDNARG